MPKKYNEICDECGVVHDEENERMSIKEESNA